MKRMRHSIWYGHMAKQEQAVRGGALALGTLLLACTLTGCLMLGGSSRGGFFLFPGGLGLIVLIVVVALILRRR